MKLPERPLDLNTLLNAKLVALLTEGGQMLSLIVKALQKKIETMNSNSTNFHLFVRDLQESHGLFHMDGELLMPFLLRNAIPRQVQNKVYSPIHLVASYKQTNLFPWHKLFRKHKDG